MFKYKQVVASVIDKSSVARWKKDLRVMTKIYKDLDPTTQDRERWDEARKLFLVFRDNFEEWIYQRLLPKETSDRARSPMEVTISKLAWDLRHHLDVFALFPVIYPSKTPNWSEFRSERDRNLRRYQGAANKLFKEIDIYLEVQRDQQVERRDPVEHFEISGIGVVVKNVGRGADDEAALDTFLRRLKQHAAKIARAGFGSAVRGLTVTLDFDIKKSEWDTAGRYVPNTDTLVMYPLGLVSERAEHGTFTHECGHRFYFKALSPSARQRWKTVMTERGVPIEQDDIDRYVALVKEVIDPARPNAVELRRVIPPKAKDEAEAAKFRELVHVPAGPIMGGPFDEQKFRELLSMSLGEFAQIEEITDYGNTDPMEAFAEVFRLWVDKGPHAVGPWTRQFFAETCRGGGVRLAGYLTDKLIALKVAALHDRKSLPHVAMEHDTERARLKYLEKHRKADPSNHTVRKTKKSPRGQASKSPFQSTAAELEGVAKQHQSDFEALAKHSVETYSSRRAKDDGHEELLDREFAKMAQPERAILIGGHILGRKFEAHLSEAEAELHEACFDRWRTTAGPYDYKGNGNAEDLELTSCKLQGLAGAFGFKGSLSPDDEELDKDGVVTQAMKDGAKDKKLLAYAKKMYDYQQAYYRHAGIEELTLYRGVKFPDTDKADEGAAVQIASREMASFTMDPAVAAHFGRVVKFKVPVRNVFASALVRPNLGSETNKESGCFHEAEVIVMGASELVGEAIGGQRTDDDE